MRGRTWTLRGADGLPYESDTPGALGGNVRNPGDRVYGRLDCGSARAALARGGYAEHRVFFADEATAVAAGFRPCGTCLKPAYAAWRGSRGARA
jgi:hypothetical protein